MFFWFVVLSILGVFVVFRDDRMDYRLVAVGSLLPDLIDGAVFRGTGPFHSVIVAVALMFGVVGGTIGRRSTRKRMLAIPIGVFAHQVLDASWAVTSAFWWPVKGFSFAGPLPVVQHGLAVGLIEEVVAVVAALSMWRALGLHRRSGRAQFLASGHLSQRRANPDPRSVPPKSPKVPINPSDKHR